MEYSVKNIAPPNFMSSPTREFDHPTLRPCTSSGYGTRTLARYSVSFIWAGCALAAVMN
jgi:hypothetical protein